MTREIEESMEELIDQETERLAYFLIVMGIMGKHGYRCTSLNKVERSSFQEHRVHQKGLLLTFVPHTEEKNTLFSIFQDLEKLRKDSTKCLKKSKMDWFLTTDTQVAVEILGE